MRAARINDVETMLHIKDSQLYRLSSDQDPALFHPTRDALKHLLSLWNPQTATFQYRSQKTRHYRMQML